MPRREVVFTGLFAFGAGVAVGANWPKASNIVGYILNRLGFELADLAVWMWDPEKTALLNQETQLALRGRSKKKAKVLRKRSKKSPSKKTEGKRKKIAQSQEIIAPLTVRKGLRVAATKARSPEALKSRGRSVRPELNAVSLSSTGPAASKPARSQRKSSVSKSARKVTAAQRNGKGSRFPSSAGLAGAALN